VYSGRREKVVPVSPWAPPLIRLGLSNQRIFAHKVIVSDDDRAAGGPATRPDAAEVYLLEANGSRRSLGLASEASPIKIHGYTIMPWDVRPYTGLHIYRRPGTLLLVAGIFSLLLGLAIALIRRRFSLGTPGAERRISETYLAA